MNAITTEDTQPGKKRSSEWFIDYLEWCRQLNMRPGIYTILVKLGFELL